jgi:hypothetical protein
MPHWIVLSDTTAPLAPSTPSHLQTASGRQALAWIENPQLRIGGLLLSPDIWDEDFCHVLTRCRTLRPGTPVHLLIDEDETDPKHPALDAGIRMQLGLSEPVSADHIDRFLETAPKGADTTTPFRAGILQEGPFVGVPISDFEDCRDLLFDLHLKMPGGKFIRLLNAREEHPWEQLRRYRDRGLTHVHVSREALERNLLGIRFFRDAIASRGNTSSGAWSEIQAAHSMTELSRLMSQLSRISDLDSEFWGQSRELLVSFRAALAVDGPIPRGEQARRWIRRSMSFEHSLSTFTVAALMGRPLQFMREDLFLQLGMAALYHDVALLDLDADISDEGAVARLTGRARNVYLEHPLRSANHLATTLNADPVVLQAVLFHHWRRDGSGPEFRGLPMIDAVPRMAEIIGLAEECANFMGRHPALDPRRLTTEFIPRVEQKFSVEVLDGLRASLIHVQA